MVVGCFYIEQFGIACERARLPQLEREPLALAGDDGLLAVVASEAARFGVRSGQTSSSARALCGGLLVLPYDRPAYEEAARFLWDLYAVESSVVEPASPELCYVELSGRDIAERVSLLASAVSTRVATPVRVGVGSSKFIARQAAMSHGEEIVSVPCGREAAFLAPVSLDSVPDGFGLDRKTRQRLDRLGVRTFGDILKLSPVQLRRLGRDLGPLLHRFAHGLDGDRVRPLWPPRSIERVVVFEDETCDLPTVQDALRQAAEEIAGELARGREFCRTVTLTLGFSDRTYRQEQERLITPEVGCSGLLRAALRLLQRLRVDRPVVEVSLRASDIGIGSGVQLALIDANAHALGLPHERRARLDATLAFLRKRYPHSAPVLCSLLRQAKRVHLWTYPLGHALALPVEVYTDREGEPVRYRGLRHRRAYEREVRRILSRWKESEWYGGPVEKSVWRVEAEENGVCDLQQLGVEWRLSAVAD
jgi:DNA polymerase-4